MAVKETSAVAKLIADNEKDILPAWIDLQKKAGTLQTGRIGEAELTAQCRDFLHLLRDGLTQGGTDASHDAYKPTRDFLAGISRSRAQQRFSPKETAAFIFSLKLPLSTVINRDKTLSAAGRRPDDRCDVAAAR